MGGSDPQGGVRRRGLAPGPQDEAVSEVADSIQCGLEQAVAYAKGEADAKRHRAHVPPEVDVRAIRTQARHNAGGVLRPLRVRHQCPAPVGAGEAAAGRLDSRLPAGHRPRARGRTGGAPGGVRGRAGKAVVPGAITLAPCAWKSIPRKYF